MNRLQFIALGVATLVAVPVVALLWGKLQLFRVLPVWLLFVLLIAICGIPAVVSTIMNGRRDRQAYRAQNGLCVHCGYDLRATPGRCPECGTSAKVK